jgi:glycosyltransferase involved in cell wall biosynthesis
MVEKKGFPYLIRACKILLDKAYDFRCLILGDGPQQGLIRQIITEAGLSDIIELPGLVYPEHIREYFAKADIFVLPCIVGTDDDIDGIPVTLMEAMAMEIPTVSTNISGIPELIEHMKTGILVPPKDEVSLANAISTLIENNDLSKKLGKAGRSKVESEFEIHKNVDLLMTIFESYVDDSHSTIDKTYH